MRLVTVSVGRPREVRDERRGTVRTGIWKQPVEGPVRVGRLNLAGDGQADLEAHGGEHKAVYAYPLEHYADWKRDLGRDDLEPGGFGENLTVEGLLEADVHIGDRYRIGTAVLEVSQPRTPCFKLALRMGDPTIVRRFTESGRSGFYLRVVTEGELSAGQAIERVARPENSLSVAELNRIMNRGDEDPESAARAAALPALSPGWRDWLQRRAHAATGA